MAKLSFDNLLAPLAPMVTSSNALAVIHRYSIFLKVKALIRKFKKQMCLARSYH